MTIRDVPDGTPGERAGQSLPDGRPGQLTAQTQRPDQTFWAGVAQRVATTGTRLSAAQILEARDADRR